MAENILITFQGDTRGLEAAAERVTKALEGVADATSKLNGSTKSFTNSMGKTSKAVQSTADALKEMNVSSLNVNQGFSKAPFRQVENNLTKTGRAAKKTASSFDVYTAAQSNAGTVLLSFSQGLQDLPFGLIAIQNNLTSLVAQFSHLQSRTKSLGGSLSLLGKALIGPTGVLLAISAIVAGVTYLTQKYGSLSAAVSALTGNFKAHLIVEQQLAKAYEEAGEDAADAAEKVLELNEMLTLSNRGFLKGQVVVDNYNEKLGDTFGKVKSVNEVEGKLAENADNFIRFTLAKAAAMKILEKASEATAKTMQDEIKPPEEFLGWWDKFKKGTLSFLAYPLSEMNSWLGFDPFYTSRKGFNEFQKQLDKMFAPDGAWAKYTQISQDLDLSKAYREEFDRMMSDIQRQFPDLFSGIWAKTGKDGGKKAGDNFLKGFDPQARIDELAKDLQSNKLAQKVFGFDNTELFRRNMKDVGALYSDFIENNIDPSLSTWTKLRQLMGSMPLPALGSQINVLTGTINPLTDALKTLHEQLRITAAQGQIFDKSQLDQLKSQASAYESFINSAIKQGIGPEQSPDLQNAIANWKSVNEQIGKITQSQRQSSAVTQNWNSVASTLSNAFEKIFDGAAGGEDVFQSLANSAKRLAVQLAAAAVSAKIISAISGQPFGKVAGSMGSRGGGGLLKLLGGLLGLPFFANGGFVNKPTLAVIGDDKTGGEYVVNQDQMNALLSNRRDVQVFGKFVLEGNDLVATVQNTNDLNTYRNG